LNRAHHRAGRRSWRLHDALPIIFNFSPILCRDGADATTDRARRLRKRFSSQLETKSIAATAPAATAAQMPRRIAQLDDQTGKATNFSNGGEDPLDRSPGGLEALDDREDRARRRDDHRHQLLDQERDQHPGIAALIASQAICPTFASEMPPRVRRFQTRGPCEGPTRPLSLNHPDTAVLDLPPTGGCESRP